MKNGTWNMLHPPQPLPVKLITNEIHHQREGDFYGDPLSPGIASRAIHISPLRGSFYSQLSRINLIYMNHLHQIHSRGQISSF